MSSLSCRLPCILMCLVFGPSIGACVFAQETNAGQPSGLVVVISGLRSDASDAQIARTAKYRRGNSGVYELMIDFKEAGFNTKFFNWNGTEAGTFTKVQGKGAAVIADFIRTSLESAKVDRLILVGHSWGGHTMLEVADLLNVEPKINVEMAFGIDASSFSRGIRSATLPENIQKLVSFYSANKICWGKWENEPRVENVFLGDPANGFMVNGQPNYDAPFSVRSHNAAEWDEKIQAAILKRVNEMVEDNAQAKKTE